MGSSCCRGKRVTGDSSKYSDHEPISISGITYDKGTFIQFNTTEKFKDHYLIGQSMGSGYYGEVRKCKNIKSGAVRSVKIVKL